MFPIIAPTRFGPLARKTLGRRYTKAEGDTQPEEPKAPKAEKPKEEPPAQATPVPEPLENGEPPTNINTPNFLPQVPYGEMIPPGQVPWEGEPVGPPPEDEPPDAPEDFIREAPIEQQEPDDKEGLPQLPSLQPIQLSFYASIKENPDDEAPCLIYADWLEENDQPDLAEAVRLDIYIANAANKGYNEELETAKMQAARQVHNLEQRHPEWFAPWGRRGEYPRVDRDAVGENGSYAAMYKGLLVTSSSARRLVHLINTYSPERLLANVGYLRLNDTYDAEALQQLFGTKDPSWLSYITQLSLNSNNLSPQNIPAAIANTTASRNLQKLYLSDTNIGPNEILPLLESPHLKNLRVLDLSYNFVSEECIDALINPKTFPHLQELILRAVWVSQEQHVALEQRYGDGVKISDDAEEYR